MLSSRAISVDETPAPIRRTFYRKSQFSKSWSYLNGNSFKTCLIFETSRMPVAFGVLYTIRPALLRRRKPGYIWDTTCMVMTRGNDDCIESLGSNKPCVFERYLESYPIALIFPEIPVLPRQCGSLHMPKTFTLEDSLDSCIIQRLRVDSALTRCALDVFVEHSMIHKVLCTDRPRVDFQLHESSRNIIRKSLIARSIRFLSH